MENKFNCLACGAEFGKSEAEQANYRCPDCGAGLSGDQADEGTNKRGRSKTLFISCALLCLAGVIFFVWRAANEKSGSSANISKAQAIEQIKKKALEINSKTPMMIDASTRLDQVVVEDMTIIYQSTLVNLTVEKWDKNIFNKEIDQFLADKYCNDSKSRQTMELGVKYGHEYFGNNGTLLYTINISFDDC